MRQIQVENYTRVSKRKARKIFESGATIYFCPVNLRPGYPYYPEILFYNTGENFDYSVSSFEMYNCINYETGKYAAFYIYNEGDVKQ